jgi:hypothetical protein
MSHTCEKCEKNFKFLTKERLCAFCHHEIHGKWAKEFSDETGTGVK